MIEHVYIINLPERTDRLGRTMTELTKIVPPAATVKVFPATHWKDIKDTNWEFLKQEPHISNRFTPGCYAVRETFIRLLKEVIEIGYESVLILEDDVKFDSIAYFTQNGFKQLPDNWDIYFLGCYHYRKPSEYSQNLVKVNGCWYGHSFIIRKKCMQAILDLVTENLRPHDLTIGMNAKYFNIYAANPTLAYFYEDYSNITDKIEPCHIPAIPYHCKEIIPLEEQEPEDYSQNGEQKIILDYFGEGKGTLIDIGANNGKTYSNSLALIRKGWKAILVEPSPEAFASLSLLHYNNSRVQLHETAIGDRNSAINFFEYTEHDYEKENPTLLSTACIDSINRWDGVPSKFKNIEVACITFKALCKYADITEADFITIDAEGFDYDILRQIDLTKLKCRMICIESNSIEDSKYISYCEKFGMKLYHKNEYNLIFIR